MRHPVHLALLVATSAFWGPSCRPPWEPRHGPPHFVYSGQRVGSTGELGAQPQGYAGAVEALASTVAASAANRAVFSTCYASCLDGTTCDAATGVCVPLPCRGHCPGGTRCKVVEGKEACVRGEERDTVAPQPAAAGAQESAAASDAGPSAPWNAERVEPREDQQGDGRKTTNVSSSPSP